MQTELINKTAPKPFAMAAGGQTADTKIRNNTRQGCLTRYTFKVGCLNLEVNPILDICTQMDEPCPKSACH